MEQTSLSCLTNLSQPPQPSAATTLMSPEPSTLRANPPLARRLQLAESADDDWYFLIQVCPFFKHNALRT